MPRLSIDADGDLYYRDDADPINVAWRFVGNVDDLGRVDRRLAALAPGADLDDELDAVLAGYEEPVDVAGELGYGWALDRGEVCRA